MKLKTITICNDPGTVALTDSEGKREQFYFDFDNLMISRQKAANSYMWSSRTVMITIAPDDVSFVFNLNEEDDTPVSKTLRVIINGMEKFRYELGDTVDIIEKYKPQKRLRVLISEKKDLTLEKLADWLKEDPYVKHDC